MILKGSFVWCYNVECFELYFSRLTRARLSCVCRSVNERAELLSALTVALTSADLDAAAAAGAASSPSVGSVCLHEGSRSCIHRWPIKSQRVASLISYPFESAIDLPSRRGGGWKERKGGADLMGDKTRSNLQSAPSAPHGPALNCYLFIRPRSLSRPITARLCRL